MKKFYRFFIIFIIIFNPINSMNNSKDLIIENNDKIPAKSTNGKILIEELKKSFDTFYNNKENYKLIFDEIAHFFNYTPNNNKNNMSKSTKNQNEIINETITIAEYDDTVTICLKKRLFITEEGKTFLKTSFDKWINSIENLYNSMENLPEIELDDFINSLNFLERCSKKIKSNVNLNEKTFNSAKLLLSNKINYNICDTVFASFFSLLDEIFADEENKLNELLKKIK